MFGDEISVIKNYIIILAASLSSVPIGHTAAVLPAPPTTAAALLGEDQHSRVINKVRQFFLFF